MQAFLIILSALFSLHIFGQVEALENMVLIPKGEFNMGKNSSNLTDWQPEHMVLIDSFYMDKYEVTNREYYEFCKATNHTLPIFWNIKEFRCGMDFPDYPVVGIFFFRC